MKNTWTKTRKPNDPYFDSVDPRTGWRYRVLKVYTDPRKPFARAFCLVTGFHEELGDVYSKEIPGLITAWLRYHSRKGVNA